MTMTMNDNNNNNNNNNNNMMMSRLIFGFLLLLTEGFETVQFAYGIDFNGCQLCEGGILDHPNKLVALLTPGQAHSCSEWQETFSLTENLDDVACSFVGLFYEAICGCSNSIHQSSPIYDEDECDLCGSSSGMVIDNPSIGLPIPNSNSTQLLSCSGVYDGAKMGAVSPSDCKVLSGIIDYCGGCVFKISPETVGPPTNVPTSIPALSSTMEKLEKLVSIAETNAPSSVPTIQPSSTVSTSTPTTTSTRTTTTTEQPTMKQFVTMAETVPSCDLCASDGTVAYPRKSITLVGNVTKTCEDLLWSARQGQDVVIDASACFFLLPFFGAICGCTTFSPFFVDTDDQVQKTTNDGEHIAVVAGDSTTSTTSGSIIETTSTVNCNICDDPSHVFQEPFNSLRIPGSDKTQITCGGLFMGATSGAVSTDECEILSTLAIICGGCGVKEATFYKEEVTETSKPPTPVTVTPKQCIGCLDENESSMYIYKDFDRSGTTFQEALYAPHHCYDKKKDRNTNKCRRPLYPELQGCVLTPITSHDELIRVQSIIPPEKAAYTAVYKDPLVLKMETEECYKNRIDAENCRVEQWKKDLRFGYYDQYETDSRSRKLQDDNISADNTTIAEAIEPCESQKSGWINFKAGTKVPSSLWKNRQPSYCNLGPTQEVGAVWPVESNGQNYGDLRDVSANWPLTGAVYKCCKKVYNCLKDRN